MADIRHRPVIQASPQRPIEGPARPKITRKPYPCINEELRAAILPFDNGVDFATLSNKSSQRRVSPANISLEEGVKQCYKYLDSRTVADNITRPAFY